MLKNPFFVIYNYDIIEMIIYSRIEDWQHFFCACWESENQGSAEKLWKKERADFKMSQLQRTHYYCRFYKVIFLLSFHYKV